MAAVADTSWLYALLAENDRFHGRAVREAEAQDAIFVPPATLVETLNVVQLRARVSSAAESPHATAAKALAALENQPTVILGEPPHDHETAARIWRATPALSYADAAIVAAARAKSLELLTFDRAQAAAHRSGKP